MTRAGRRGSRARRTDPSENIRVFTEGTGEIDRMLAFRDWLRNNEGDRLVYERTKRELAAREWK